ncbi:MAG: TonB family protein, partial [Bacteroidota bacterium]
RAPYLQPTTLSWFLLYGIYYVFLRQRTFYQYNRWFLIGTLLGGALLPLLPDYLAAEIPAEQLLLDLPVVYVGWFDPLVFEENMLEASSGTSIWPSLLWSIYLAGALLFFSRFCYGLYRLYRVKKTAEYLVHQDYTLLKSKKVPSPFSFFRYVYWNPKLNLQQEEGAAILAHELAHVRRGHSLDILFLELLQILLWFHPLIPIIKKSIRNVHEYQADADVLKQVPVRPYGQILLYQARYNDPQLLLVNHFFTTQIKQRIIMMTRKPSSKRQLWAYALAMPVLVVMGLLFLQTEAYAHLNMPTENLPVELTDYTTDPDKMPVFEGCQDAGENQKDCSNQQMFQYILKNMKYPKAAKDAGVEGMAVISFKIDASGKVIDAKIIKDPGAGCGETALGIVNSMPKWQPGMKDGKPVAVEMKLPFKFALEGKDEKSDQAKLSEVDQMPVFATCSTDLTGKDLRNCSNQALFGFVGKNLRYPKTAVEAEIEGMVVASFMVETDGSVSNVKVVRSIGGGCDEEVMRVVYSMDWKPAMKDGKAVAAEMKLPVKFVLEGAKQMNKSALKYDLNLENYRLAPNPSRGLVDLNFKGEKGTLSVRIFNSNGQMVFEDQQAQFDGFFQKEVNLKAQGAGLYFLQIRQNGKTFIDKIV